ncbi:hypothetical protein VTJ83DRAFT_3810 [Remersonia thermophila]|uniref:Uncharacterized protein n=1 Tax=Remersonia thermophila TaxID=72144 RepID=A0ABR4DHC8_9PEZI
MRLLPLLAGLLTPAFALMEFIIPPKAGPVGDLRGIPTYEVGSFLEVTWTAGKPGKAASVTLWQLDPRTYEWFGSIEYVIQNTVDVTSVSWVVGTRKDLSVSNLFMMSVFEAGNTSPDSNSQYFYIVRPGQTPTPATTNRNLRTQTVSSSSAPTQILSATGISTSSSTEASSASASSKEDDDNTTTSTTTSITTSAEPTSTTPPPFFPADSARLTDESSTNDGLSTTARITIGVLVPFGVILGAVVMYLWHLNHRKRDLEAGPPPWSGQQQNVNVNLSAPLAGYYKLEGGSIEARVTPPPETYQRDDGTYRGGSANQGAVNGGSGYTYPSAATVREPQGMPAELPGS